MTDKIFELQHLSALGDKEWVRVHREPEKIVLEICHYGQLLEATLTLDQATQIAEGLLAAVKATTDYAGRPIA